MKRLRKTMNGLQVRLLDLEDYDAIMNLWQRSGISSLRPFGRDSAQAFAHQLDVDATTSDGTGLQAVLGLEKDGQLIGVVIATHDGRKGWINRLAIAPDHRREGHARRLITAAEEALRAQGIMVIAALIERENKASLALFRQLGYHLHDNVCYLSKRESAEV